MEPESTQSDEVAALTGSLPDILAVIESAKARGGMDALERFITKALPEASEEEVAEAAEVALEVIESVPIFFVRARQAAEERDLSAVVVPLLARAEHYYLQPIDLIPEMTQGLPGLLDDSYLVIRMLQNLDRGPQAFLDWDLDYPQRFLSRLVGPNVAQRLDRLALDAMDDVQAQLAELWVQMASEA